MAKWMKKNLFPTPAQSMLSIILFSLILKMLTPFLDWFVYDAVWLGSADDCRQASGACVAFIREKFTFILFGFYPREYLWRPIAAIGLFICMLWYSKEPSRWSKRLVRRWVVYVFLWILLMRGGMFGFE
ncbi:MAG: amino acid ABC transporter permease, partial [Halobacteriovoraceae bacterium]|nr:amino acid ABC transporter permease [Halobacteriovoraceae bacterium]